MKDIFNIMEEAKYNIVEHNYSQNELEINNMKNEFQSMIKRQQFNNIGIVLENGKTYDLNDDKADMSNQEFYHESMRGRNYISDPLINSENKEVIILSSPMYNENDIIGVMYVSYFIDDFRDKISVNSFSNEGYSYVIKQNGDSVIDSSHETSFDNFKNLFVSLADASQDNDECSKQLKEDLNKNQKVACVILDIEQFKLINDIFGYDAGNKVIQFIAEMIEKNLNKGEIFARITAEQFIILLAYSLKDELEERILKIKNEISDRVVSTSHENYSLRTVIGIYEVKDLSENIQYIQNCAVIAHTQAKKRYDMDYLFYDDDMRNRLLANKKLEDRMKKAIKNNEFIVYYQPKYDTKSKKPNGAEALIRWQEKNGIIHTPAEFIHLAEINGFIKKLDEIVFYNVCKDIRELLDQDKFVLPVSVNISKKTLYDSSFINRYMTEFDIPVNLIQLEITENLLIDDEIKMKNVIKELQKRGFKILMDDFGTGYSSLQMLKDIPIDILKLDKSFVDDYQDGKGSEILKATVSLAQAMKIDIVAEGVETKTQYEYLKELNCNSIQGYYFSKPLNRNKYMKLIQNNVSN